MSLENHFHEKLVEMRHKYLEKETHRVDLPEQQLQKSASVKAKLADLEVQRCQLLREHRDLNTIETKILKQKERLEILKSVHKN